MRTLQLDNKEKALLLLDELISMQPALSPTNISGRVVLYGAGNLGKLALGFLKHIGVKAEYALDRKAEPGMKLDNELPVFSPFEVKPENDIIVLVTTVNAAYTSICDQLIDLGFKNVMPFYDYAQLFRDIHPINNGWFSGKLSKDDTKAIRSTMMSLDDAASLSAYLQFLAWRIVREDWVFENVPITLDDRYFIAPIKKILTDSEIFFDIGAYDGRALQQFLEVVDGKFASAHLFEPDGRNIEMLKKTLSEMAGEIREKVELHPFAVYGESGTFSFSSGFDMASRLADINPEQVKTSRLDDMHIKPTFMKLHIEGGEYDALKGSLSTIMANRPVLAITLYHNRDGLWKIPQLLMQVLDDYSFYFRLHAWCGASALLYGIPKERTI